MEKNTPTSQLEENEDIIAKAQANKRTIVWCFSIAFRLIIGGLAWILIAQAGSAKADGLIAKADAVSNDSVAVELYKEAANAGYKSGHRAAAEVAIRLYQDGKYEDAIKYLDKADLDDEIAAAGVYTLKGDCYVNLNQNDKALSCYSKAVSKADKNPEIVPLILIKEANIYRAEEKYADEAKCYKEILDEYPVYVQESRTDIRKYYERALAQSKN